MSRSEAGIILLAAGSSSRMGQSKQLLHVHGKALLFKSVQTAIQTGSKKIVVVLGAYQKEHRAIIEHLPIDIVVNERWQNGMGSSLKTGMTSLLSIHPSVTGVILLVCDQPLLTAAHLTRLIEKHAETQKPIVASGYANVAGVPAYFDRSYFDKLLKLEDDHGARKIIHQNKKDVFILDFPPGAVDLDTPEDFDSFTKHTKS
jgi:molybdenum cofactor cytidylyltransferase